MIAVLSLNPAVDKIISVRNLRWGEHLRVKKIRELAAGKGINVARVIKKLGGEVVVLGLAGGPNGEWIKEELRKEKLRFDFVPTRENVRQSLTIMDEEKNREIHLREEGNRIRPQELHLLKRSLKAWAPYINFAVISGRLPAGVPIDFYAELIAFFKKIEVPVLLDANGPAFKIALKARPDYLKPNHSELEELAGRRFKNRSQELSFIKRLLAGGVKMVVVTHGPKEVLAGLSHLSFLLKPPKLKIRNTVGCGDAVTAALAFGLTSRMKIDELLKLAVACGSANALSLGVGLLDLKKAAYLSRKIDVQILSHHGY